jgi:hypothetical protein
MTTATFVRQSTAELSQARLRWEAANPEVVAFLKSDVQGDFINSMRLALHRWGALTPRQAAAVVKMAKIAEERKAEAATATPVVEGRQTITGTVVRTKWDFGPYGEALKMLVLDDRGFKVWGTVPASILSDDLVADVRVRFDATVKAGRENGFGFYSRPTKAEVI